MSLTSYFKLVANLIFYTVVGPNWACLKVLASGEQVWPGFFKFWAGLACSGSRTVHLWYFLADAILTPGDGGWAGVAVGVDYVVGCAVGVGGDRSSIILPWSFHCTLPHSELPLIWQK